MGVEEEFAPPASADGKQPIDPLIVQLSVGAVAILLLFGLYFVLQVILSRPAPPVVSAPPPRPVAHTDEAPPPVVIEPTPPPATAQAPVVVVPPAATGPAWMHLTPVAPKLAVPPITDEGVGIAITRAVAWLESQFDGDQLAHPDPSDFYAGSDALVVYSLLHAGEAIDDSNLSLTSPATQAMLNRLRQYQMSSGNATYCRALRASALAMFNRDVDATQLGKDRKWLLDSEVNGSYTYSMPPKDAYSNKDWEDSNYNWDNSNSQYGVLGIWATVQAGISAPDKYWNDVEQHWLGCQQGDGGWGYHKDGSTLTMTCAGVTTLCVTAEQLELVASKGHRDAHPQLSQAIDNGLSWLAVDNHLLQFNPDNKGYSLYGVERAALATGYRWFGDHDWYRELGTGIIKTQDQKGSWDSSPRETAFRLLFLSRGRQPILINKLRFDGDWNDRPRDAAKLTEFASAQLEKPFAWGVADLSRNWWDWMETPFLFITTDAAPSFSDQDCQKLRSYTDAGGMIFLHNEYASQEVDDFASDLAKRMYPEYALTPVAPDDLIYSTVFPMKIKPPLKSVGNGTRTFLVYSPKDITEDWVRFKAKDSKQNLARQLGLNLFVAAAGKTDFRNRLNSPYEEPPDFDPIGTVPILQISYRGPWNPETKAFERFGRWFQKQTSIKLEVQPTAMLNLSANQGPVALLTGNSTVDFSRMDLHALHDYVAKGGVLVIDSTGGNKPFAASVHESLLPSAFPGLQLSDLPPNHPILAGGRDCMDSIPKPRLRNFASLILNAVAPNIQYATVGKGTIIISDLDLTTGLLNSGTYGILGYTPAYSQSLLKNVILWALGK